MSPHFIFEKITHEERGWNYNKETSSKYFIYLLIKL